MAKSKESKPVPIPLLVSRLNDKYPNATYELDWTTPLELLIGTILAAQCTDERVNKLTPALFKRYPDARAYAESDREELEELIKGSGFFRQKSESIQGVCKELVERFGGEVPETMEELTTLPRVARKTANVVLNIAFKIPSGIIVDTHAFRVAARMGLSAAPKPEKTEEDLMKIIPQEEWVTFGPAMVLHGRYTCTNSAPKCSGCMFAEVCPKIGV